MNPVNPATQVDIWDLGLHIPAVNPVNPVNPVNNPGPAQDCDTWNDLYISSTNQVNSISVPALAPDGDRSRQHVQLATVPRTCGIAAPNGHVPARPLLAQVGSGM